MQLIYFSEVETKTFQSEWCLLFVESLGNQILKLRKTLYNRILNYIIINFCNNFLSFYLHTYLWIFQNFLRNLNLLLKYSSDYVEFNYIPYLPNFGLNIVMGNKTDVF